MLYLFQDLANLYILDNKIIKNRLGDDVDIQNEKRKFNNVVTVEGNKITVYCNSEKHKRYLQEVQRMKKNHKKYLDGFTIFFMVK